MFVGSRRSMTPPPKGYRTSSPSSTSSTRRRRCRRRRWRPWRTTRWRRRSTRSSERCVRMYIYPILHPLIWFEQVVRRSEILMIQFSGLRHAGRLPVASEVPHGLRTNHLRRIHEQESAISFISFYMGYIHVMSALWKK